MSPGVVELVLIYCRDERVRTRVARFAESALDDLLILDRAPHLIPISIFVSSY